MARLLFSALAGEDFEEGLVDVMADVGADDTRAAVTQVRCCWFMFLSAAAGGRFGMAQVGGEHCLNLPAW